MSKNTGTRVQVGGAFKAPRREQAQLSSSQSSVASTADLSQSGAEDVSTVSAATSAAEKLKTLMIPMDFKDCNAIDILDVEVPDHIIDRWQMIDKHCKVEALFGSTAKANKSLDDICLRILLPLTGETEFAAAWRMREPWNPSSSRTVHPFPDWAGGWCSLNKTPS